MPPIRMLASGYVRLAALCAALFVVTTVVVLAAVYVIARDQLQAEIDALLRTQATVLRTEHERLGTTALIQRIDARAAQRRERAWVILRSGEVRVAGPEVLGLTRILDGLSTTEVDLPDAEPEPTRILALTLPGDLQLILGYPLWPIHRATASLAEALLLGVVAAVLAAIFIGIMVARRAGRRVDAMAVACSRIMDGSLTERLPTRGSGDEYDRLAETVNAMVDRLGTLLEGVRRVSADIAHDLRTPLARLRQRLELARVTARTPEDVQTALDEAVAETDGLLTTFAALLRIAQIESGARRDGFTDFDLVERLRLLADTYEAVADEGGHTLQTILPNRAPIRGDKTLIAQAIANLIDNALRYAGPQAEILVSLACAPGWREIVVADRGPGIPDAERDKVVHAFYRVDSSRTSAGAGLGLSLVTAVARLHGGLLRLEDNAPGLRAVLVLPEQPA